MGLFQAVRRHGLGVPSFNQNAITLRVLIGILIFMAQNLALLELYSIDCYATIAQ